MSKTKVEMIISNNDPFDEDNLWNKGEGGYIDGYVDKPDGTKALVVLGDRVVVCDLSDFKTLKDDKPVKVKKKKWKSQSTPFEDLDEYTKKLYYCHR